jgi:hypothetical protein
MARINVKRLNQYSRVIASSLSLLIISYVLASNYTPLGVSVNYQSGKTGLSNLIPQNRVEEKNGTSTQKDNLIYFTSDMIYSFDTSKIKVTFKNHSNDQQILLGYRNQSLWHYSLKALDIPFINNLNWQKVGSGPYLYQKTAKYSNMSDFLNNPPKNKVLGIIDYNKSDFIQSYSSIPQYQPSNNETSIVVPLRGKTIMYAYLKGEPFKMTFTKHDLNWYSDPDVVKISVFKEQKKVFDATIDDDDNVSSNHKTGPSQSITIQNPGPGLPEAGVYKVVIDAADDSLITNIKSSLHKIAFEGPLYVADNHEVYGSTSKTTRQTTLFSNAQHLNIRSDHGQSNSATVGQQTLKITQPNSVVSATNTLPVTQIIIPNSDMLSKW